MSDPLLHTVSQLQELAQTHEAVLVSFSGGKDSLAVLDLAVKHFSHVVAFHMYFVPGLQYVEQQLDAARNRYNVQIIQLPHWRTIADIKEGVYCDRHFSRDDLPPLSLDDIHNCARAIAGISLILNGGKRSDGQWRRRSMSHGNWQGVAYPLEHWNKYDVLAYLAFHQIPVPEASLKKVKSGAGLQYEYLHWLHREHPADFDRVRQFFPYVDAPIQWGNMYA